MSGALSGRRIVVPESRELDLFVGMLERQGASAIRCPMVTIHDVEDAAPIEAWLRRLADDGRDILVFLTGEGVARLLGFARRAGIEGGVIEGMRRAVKIVRGPKPTRALRAAGLAPDLTAQTPTTEGVLAGLSKLTLAGRSVGIQLYPESPDTLARFVAGAGGQADPVLPYRYASDEEDERVAAIIRDMAEGRVDLIAFTSSPQVRRLQEVAGKRRLDAELRRAVERTRIAAVGPVTADAVGKAGWRVSVSPQDSFHLKPFVAEIAGALRESAPSP